MDDFLALHDCDLMERDEQPDVHARINEFRGIEGQEKYNGLGEFVSRNSVKIVWRN